MSSEYIIDDTVQGGATGEEIYAMINERRSLIGDVPEYYDLITSNTITDVLLPYDTKALRNTALSSYTTTTALNTLLSGKEANLTFNAPLTRSTNTISLDLSSYTTTSALNTALTNYIPKTSTSISLTGTNPFYTFGTTSDGLSKASTAGAYSGSASIGDLIIRSEGTKKLILQHSSGTGAIIIDSNNNTTINNTLTVNSISSTGLVNTYFTSNQLASQQFINSNSIDLNYIKKYVNNSIDVNTIAITGGNATYDGGVVDATNKTNTFISFKDAGASTDWCYLRQIGGTNSYKLALDFCDDGSDARFCIRNNQSTLTPDTITEVFTVDNGNVTATGTINGATIQQGGVGVSTLITNALSSYTTTTALTTLLNAKESILTFSSPLVRTVNTISLDTNLSGLSSNQLASQKFINSNSIDLNYMNRNGSTIFDGELKIKGNKLINLGYGLTKEASAGGISYGYHDANALCIVGAGTVSGSRNIRLWDNVYIKEGILSFGSRLGDNLIDLFGGGYGFGINSATLRYNSGSAHKFYAGTTNTFSIDGSGNISATGILTLNTSTQLQSRINLTGQEFYQASNTSTDGVALLLGVNRTGNRQLWIADTAKLTQNATNPAVRISSEGYIDCVATNGTTSLPLFLSGSAIWLQAPTQCSSSLGVTGTLTANSISSTGLTASLATKEAVLTFSSPLTRVGNTIGLDANLSGLTSNQLASQQFINSNSVSLNYLQKSAGGYVGIGTTKGNISLDAWGTDNMIGRAKITGGGHDADKVDSFIIGRSDGTIGDFTGIKCNVTLGSTVGETYSNHTHINFFTWGNNIAGSREVARITSRGRLGIGSTLPAFEIDTAGSIRATNQVLAYAGSGNGYINMNNGGTGATGYLGIYNPSGTRCCYIGAMNNANTYMPIVAESPCIGFDFSGKLKVYGNLLEDYYFNNNGNPHATLTDFNNITTFGYNFIQGTTNAPTYNSVVANGAGQFYSWSCGLGSQYAYSTYVCQMAVGRNVANPYLNVRYRENGTWGGWNKIASGIADNIVSGANITVGTISAGATTLSSTLSVAGTTTCSSTLTTAGEIQTTGTNVINFGYNVSKTDGATGRIGYGTYEANALCIVGGSTSGSRKVVIWDYVEIKGLLNITGSLTMPNGSYLYGGNNVLKRQGLYLSGVYGGGYYYNTIDYSNYVSTEWGYEYCFRITAYNTDTDIPSACLQCYHVWLRNNNGTRTSYATVLGQTAGCGIQIGTNNTNLALTYPNNTAGSGLKHIIFENIAWASS